MLRQLPLWGNTEYSCWWEKQSACPPSAHGNELAASALSGSACARLQRLEQRRVVFQILEFVINDTGNSCPAVKNNLSMCTVKVAEQAVPLLIAPWGEDAMVLRGRFVVRAAASQVFLIMPWKHKSRFCIALSVTLVLMDRGQNSYAWQPPTVHFTLNMTNVTAVVPSTGLPCCVGGTEEYSLLQYLDLSPKTLKITPNPSYHWNKFLERPWQYIISIRALQKERTERTRESLVGQYILQWNEVTRPSVG